MRSCDCTVGSSDNPLTVDEGAATEVESSAGLQRHLPWPRSRDGVHAIYNPGNAGDNGTDGGDTTALTIGSAEQGQAGQEPQDRHLVISTQLVDA